MSQPLFLSRPSLACAMGADTETCRERLFSDRPPDCLRAEPGFLPGRSPWLGRLCAGLPDLGAAPAAMRSRNNALLAALVAPLHDRIDAAMRRYGRDRLAIVIGTSTSGIAESERALLEPGQAQGFHYGQQEMGQGALFLRHWLGSSGPAYVLSTACSSSAKAVAAGARLIRAGLADLALVGGADTLCRFTVAGFDALESLSAERCNPSSRNRRGINIGEGGALFLLDREPGPVRLAGCGESADAHHMSAPDPSGAGALAAMRQALAEAGITAPDLDYINLHGTATQLNDAMEARAVHALGAAGIACSSTKPLTGHTLGAAGAIEAALCWLALAENPLNLYPPHHYDGEFDPQLPALALALPGSRAGRSLRHVLSNSFAFGGSNASLLLSAA